MTELERLAKKLESLNGGLAELQSRIHMQHGAIQAVKQLIEEAAAEAAQSQPAEAACAVETE